MQHAQAYYKELLSGFIRSTITADQVKELYLFIEQEPDVYERLMNDPDLVELIRQNAEQSPAELQPAADQRIWQYLQAYSDGAVQAGQHTFSPGRVVPLSKRRRSWGWVAAAVILVAGAATALMYYYTPRVVPGQVAVTPPVLPDVKAPLTNRATITLANGEQVSLDSLNKGLLAQQGNTKLIKLDDGRIAYQPDAGKAAGIIQYNTLYNPRGSKAIDMVLSEGTHVWLNAASSIKYPVSFAGNERKVAITGEAYFEVSPDASKPFYVNKGNMEIKVLGTRFNVNTYDDEDDIKVTLLKGAVKVSNNALDSAARRQAGGGIILHPGQQAVVAMHAPIKVISNTDLAAVMAWKDGLFNFNKASLQDVMRQLARWYDVNVEYQGAVSTKTIGGEMQRDLSLSEVLDGLTDLGVHSRIEGKKILVMP